MSQLEITKSFPPNQARGLEPNKFANLLRPAFLRFLSVISTQDPKTYRRTIYYSQNGAIPEREVSFPIYRRWSPERAQDILRLKELKNFLKYLWDRGEPRYSFRGVNPNKQSWEIKVIYEVIFDPLSRILESIAVEEAIDSGQVTFWNLPDTTLEFALEELVLRFCHGKRRYIVKCPLGDMEEKPGAIWKISDEIKLRFYTPREHVNYLSRHIKNFQNDDSLSLLLFSKMAALEIISTFPYPKHPGWTDHKVKALQEQIVNYIDIVKWALCMGFKSSSPLTEGTVTYQDILGGDLHPCFSNFFTRQHSSQGPVYKNDRSKTKNTVQLVRKALKIQEQCPDLKEAFWYWGRSCVQALERDALLDAVIGLENLLVKNRGESRYRFNLHGAALMTQSAEDAETCAKDLKSLYDKRSSAAHGKREETRQEANKARKYLGQAILSVIELVEKNIFDPSKKISEQIEKEVLKRVPLSNATKHQKKKRK